MAKTYLLYKDSTSPEGRTLVHESMTRKEVVEFAEKQAVQQGAELPYAMNHAQLIKFLKDIDYDLIPIVEETHENEKPASSNFTEEKFKPRYDMYFTKIKLGRTEGEDDRPPITLEWMIDEGMDVDLKVSKSDTHADHEPTDEYVSLMRGFNELALGIQDFILSETIDRMTVQSVSIKWKNDDFSPVKQLMGLTISYVVHHPELGNKYSCGNTPFMMFESYLENNDDKTGQIGISRQWENHLRTLMLETQKYLKGKYKNVQTSIFNVIEG